MLVTDDYYYNTVTYEKLLGIFDCIEKAKQFAKEKLIEYKKHYPLTITTNYQETEDFIHPRYHIRIYKEDINKPINLDKKIIEFDTSVWNNTKSDFWDKSYSI